MYIIFLCCEFLVWSEFAPCSCYSRLTCWQHSVQPELVQSVDGTKHTIKWSTNLVTRLKSSQTFSYTMKAWEAWVILFKFAQNNNPWIWIYYMIERRERKLHHVQPMRLAMNTPGLHVNMWACQVTHIACGFDFFHMFTHSTGLFCRTWLSDLVQICTNS